MMRIMIVNDDERILGGKKERKKEEGAENRRIDNYCAIINDTRVTMTN